ncbi:MAG: NACHT domain-containing protein [Anaerolineales bacterium]|nr:MAG: NACHT domain-containing protein [Anaerolineales bacterium]
MKRKESKGSAWTVVKRLVGVLVFCLLAMLAAEAVRLIPSTEFILSKVEGIRTGAHDRAWAQEPTPVVVVQATPTPAPTPAPTGNPLLDLWQNPDVRKLIIAGVIGAIIALIFQRMLPWLWQKGNQLLSWLVGALGFEGGWQFRQRYLRELIGQHHYLKLVGVGGESDLQQPRLEEVFISLQMGTTDEAEESQRPLSIGQVLRAHQRLVVLGEPGAGKSTLLDYLTLVFAGELDQRALGLQEKRLPIFCALRRCAGVDEPLGQQLYSNVHLPVESCPKGFFERQLRRGRCVVLLDGLDEVVDPKERSAVARRIEQLAGQYPRNRYVVTCRTAGWEPGLLGGDFAVLRVRDFDENAVARFVRRWYRAVLGETAAWRAGADRRAQQEARAAAQVEAQKEAKDLLAALARRQSLRRLADNPLILSLISLVYHLRRNLPRGRAELYGDCLRILLDLWDQKDKQDIELPADAPSWNAKRAMVQQIAYHFHTAPEGAAEATADELTAIVAPVLKGFQCPMAPEQVLTLIEERSGIVVDRGLGRYGFAHRTLQEYLTATAIQEAPGKESQLLRHLGQEPWREVILLYVGLPGVDADPLLRQIIQLPDDEAHNKLLLAGQCLSEDLQVEDQTRQDILARLDALFRTAPAPLTFQRAGAVLAEVGGQQISDFFLAALSDHQPQVRAAAAEALGRLGQEDPTLVERLRQVYQEDPSPATRHTARDALLRLGQGDLVGMVLVPDGEFRMGSDDHDAWDDEKPPHPVYLDAYYIDRTPVTDAEFSAFVQASGYKPKHWQLRADAHPAVNVTWHDAQAYARWAGKALPTEAEWEKAARGTDGRRYPWGDDFDPARCNTAEKAGGRALPRSLWRRLFRRKEGLALHTVAGRGTTPVGAYSPGGDSPYGVADMAGNVWEWTSSLYKDYPYQADDGREDPDASGKLVLRGGSWFIATWDARCSFRDSNDPVNYDVSLGFRCVVRVAPIGLQCLAKVPHVYGRADSAVRRTTDRFLVGMIPTE